VITGLSNGADTFTATPGSPVATGDARSYQSIWYAKNIAGGSTTAVTASFSDPSNYTTITAFEVSGLDTTSPFVTEAEANGTSTSITTASLSLGSLNCAIFGIYACGGPTPTPFTGYTQTAADFFRTTYSSVDGVGGFLTGDYRLGVLSSHLFGAALRADLEAFAPTRAFMRRMTLWLDLERYFNSNNYSANILETGLEFRF
jgi:hypothetical protein